MVYYLTNFSFFGITLLYYYANLRSSIIFYLSSGDLYLSLDISLSCSFIIFFWIILQWTLSDFRNSISSFITNQITICFHCFLNYFFEVVLSATVADCLAWSRRLWLYLPLNFWLIFLPIILPTFLAKDKNP